MVRITKTENLLGSRTNADHNIFVACEFFGQFVMKYLLLACVAFWSLGIDGGLRTFYVCVCLM